MTNTTNQVQQFFSEEVSKSPAVREQLKAATNLENFSEIVVEIGEEKGYSFTKEEVKTAMANDSSIVAGQASDELEELELESVSGGVKKISLCTASVEF